MTDSHGHNRDEKGFFNSSSIGASISEQESAGVDQNDTLIDAENKINYHRQIKTIGDGSGNVSIIPLVALIVAFIMVVAQIPTLISSGFDILGTVGYTYKFALPITIFLIGLRWLKFEKIVVKDRAKKVSVLLILWLILRSLSMSVEYFVDIIFCIITIWVGTRGRVKK